MPVQVNGCDQGRPRLSRPPGCRKPGRRSSWFIQVHLKSPWNVRRARPMSFDPINGPRTEAACTSFQTRYPSVGPSVWPATRHVSVARASLFGPDTWGFSEETARLLHDRLRSVSFITALVFGLAFAYQTARGLPNTPLRAGLLVVVIGLALFLRSTSTPSLGKLRLIEMALFGT